MTRHLAEFVGTDPNFEPITAVACTASFAIDILKMKLRKRLKEMVRPQIDDIYQTGIVPERLECSDFERDACAVLYGSHDLRPHIIVRRLPPHA